MAEETQREKTQAAAEEPSLGRAAEELTRGVTELVGAVFGVGAAVAKSVAQATAPGKPLPPPPAPQGALGEMVHYGLLAATNLVRLTVSGAQAARAGAKTEAAQAAPEGARPAVSQGATLRIPLSIENPGPEPMQHLQFRALRVETVQVGEGARLGVSNVRLEPAVLSVAARDFEKLTVYVYTLPQTAPGIYRAVIGTADGGLETAVEFEVIAPGAGKT
jgi:hypothetical protein